MSASTVGVLLPTRAQSPGQPEDLPMGRAALVLEREGIRVVFGAAARAGALTGFVARPGRWDEVHGLALDAAHDRYPSQLLPSEHDALLGELTGIPIGNPREVSLLCQDKVATQQFLVARGIDMPEVEVDPQRFDERLREWGVAVIKPRYGTFGRGVSMVAAGDAVPRTELTVDGPPILQRAVEPPQGWLGAVVRLNAQRESESQFHFNPAVLRRSRSSRVVRTIDRCEIVLARDELSADTMRAVREIGDQVCAAFADHEHGDRVVELGLDFVVDPAGRPWPIEVNSRPRGRLAAVAEHDSARFHRAHLEACMRPLRYLAGYAQLRK